MGKSRKKNRDPSWKPSKAIRHGPKRKVPHDHPFKLWGKAVKLALASKGKTVSTFGVKKNTPEYTKAKEIFEKLKKEAKELREQEKVKKAAMAVENDGENSEKDMEVWKKACEETNKQLGKPLDTKISQDHEKANEIYKEMMKNNDSSGDKKMKKDENQMEVEEKEGEESEKEEEEDENEEEGKEEDEKDENMDENENAAAEEDSEEDKENQKPGLDDVVEAAENSAPVAAAEPAAADAENTEMVVEEN